MRIFRFVVVLVAMGGSAFVAQGEEPAVSPPAKTQNEGPLGAIQDLSMPMWLPVLKPSPDAKTPSTPSPAHVHQMIWLTECQEKIGLTEEQKKALQEIKERRWAEVSEYNKRNAALTPEERKAKAVESQAWRSQFEEGIRKEIEQAITPDQLKALKEYSFPQQAIALMQKPSIRRALGFTPEQEESLRRIRKERWGRIQLENMKVAEKTWDLLTPEQQAEMAEVVKRQGPTSAALSIGWELGFDFEGVIEGYPMLAVAPARERLKLSNEQEKQLQVVMDEATKRVKARLERAYGDTQLATPGVNSEADGKRQVEAILTPTQLKMIEEIDFRRKVVLALGYPEKRKTIRMTEKQEADLQRLNKSQEMQDALVRMDQETSDQALKILTSRQREQLQEEIDKLGW
jgi:hypothetical protein